MLLRLRPAEDHLVRRLADSLRVRGATARCLVGRGVTDPSAAQSFIDPRLAALRAPAGLAGMQRAVERIADAVVRGERIGVFGDYDVDGVTTAALLTSFLREVGATVECAVARRDAGYGFTPAAAADFAKRACPLVITGDCGTSDLDAILAGAALGMEVIVVDHHTVPSADKLGAHPAYALVNPFRADSTFPFRGMASVGLAFYVAATVRTELRDRGWFGQGSGRREPDVRDLLDLVALGTIADLVPLTSENRILTSLGLRRIESRARPGIAAMLSACGVTERGTPVDAHTVAWKLAPRLNAPGRLGAAEPSLSLLLADESTATERAQVLEAANTERRQIQQRVVDEALESIAAKLEAAGGDPGPAIVISGEGWPTGIVGLVASKLVDLYQRPAFVVGIDPATGLGRGSARTPGTVNLYDALHLAAKAMPAGTSLDRFGGHAAAAGFTVQRESFEALSEALGAACGKLAAGSGPVVSGREVDAEVRLAEVDERLATELAGLGPFGQHNPAPLLVTRNSRVTAVRRVGNDKHLKLTLEDSSSAIRSAIGFNLGDRQVEVGAHLDLAFVPTVSTYQGRSNAELRLEDLAIV
ncbi:MAG: single-stranded-DNA-specific exonuclease RecJ [Deltaproteobacteria bacterium]|nr:single-stranded-DNA-specific exonuclease RecJ [Deltaproteobacteria bacterium]